MDMDELMNNIPSPWLRLKTMKIDSADQAVNTASATG